MKEPDHLYFVAYPIEPDGSRWVKIGRTENTHQRFMSLRGHTPYPLEVLGIAVGKGSQERATHKALAAFRGNGEWFLLSREQWEGLRDRLAREFPEWPEQVDRCRDAWLAKRGDRRKDPEVQARERAYAARYQRGADVRERDRTRARERWHADAEYREKQKTRLRERAKDPEVRARAREYMREYRKDPEVRAKKNKAERIRAQDPERKAKKKERERERYKRKRMLESRKHAETD